MCHRHTMTILQQLSLWTPTTWEIKKTESEKSRGARNVLIDTVIRESHWGVLLFRRSLSAVKHYLSDRFLGDTVHAPTSQCSCEDTDWHSPRDRSDPCLHSAHLGHKKLNPSFPVSNILSTAWLNLFGSLFSILKQFKKREWIDMEWL